MLSRFPTWYLEQAHQSYELQMCPPLHHRIAHVPWQLSRQSMLAEIAKAVPPFHPNLHPHYIHLLPLDLPGRYFDHHQRHPRQFQPHL
jgi:hypothetical protein